MKPNLLRKLDLLAAAEEARLLDDIGRANGAITQAEKQRAILAAYRERLAATWRGGAEIPASTARRAGIFHTASLEAETQINQTATKSSETLQTGLDRLAATQARRKKLHAALAKHARGRPD